MQALFQAVRRGDDEQAEQLVAQLDQRAAPELRARLTDADPNVRWWAVRALAALGAAPHDIAAQLDDASGEVRACAALALAQMSGDPSARVEAIIDALAAHLSDADAGAANLSALALARLGPAASPALVRALEENQANAAVRIRAAQALASAAAPEAIPALVRALEDASALVQYYAENALERLGVGLVLVKP